MSKHKIFVREKYAMVNFYDEGFERTVVTRCAAIDIETLLGTLAGNLGPCVSVSTMTIFECIELGAFALLSVPFFNFGIKMSDGEATKRRCTSTSSTRISQSSSRN